MTFQPFIDAPSSNQFHATSAVIAFALGMFMLTRKKGDPLHKFSGYVWVSAMGVAILTSWLIGEIRTWGPFSYIHNLSLWAGVNLVLSIRAARKGNIRAHAAGMKGLYFGGLIVAGSLAFAPGRVLNEILFGQPSTKGFYAILALSGLGMVVVWLRNQRTKPTHKISSGIAN